MIELDSYRTFIDWAEWIPIKIDESKIKGFELHYRGDGEWFVLVHQKQGDTYEIGKGTSRRAISNLLNNPNATILKIVNYHASSDFVEELAFVMDNKQPSVNRRE